MTSSTKDESLTDGADLDRSRRLARRKMAWISFSVVVGYAIVILAGLLLGPATFAAGLATASGILTTIMGAFVAIILGYLGASAYEAVR